MLRVDLDGDEAAFRPGGILTGRIVWELSQTPREIEAYLAWATEGKGDEDGDMVVEQTWIPSAASGIQPFRWQLPRGPLSLDGNLIRIRWSIECSTTKPDEDTTVPIILSHLQRPIVLTSTK